MLPLHASGALLEVLGALTPVHCTLFCQAQFKENVSVLDDRKKAQLLEDGEAMLEEYKHPDPYILMYLY